MNCGVLCSTSAGSTLKFRAVATGLVTAVLIPAGLSFADLPEVMGLLPDNVQVVVGTGRIATMDLNWDQFLGAVSLKGIAPSSLLDMVSEGGWDSTGLDTNGSMAMAVLKGQWDAASPPMVIFLPVTNYEQWLAAHTPEPVAGMDKVTKVTFAESGASMFARSAGNYAVLGVDSATVNSYAAGAKPAENLKTLIGTKGAGVVESNDLFAIVDLDGMEAVLGPKIEEGMAQWQQTMAMMGAAGGADAQKQMERNAKLGQAAARAILNQGKCLTVGMRGSEKGVTTSFAMSFKPDGWMAQMLPGAASPANYLSKLPSKPFMFAMSGELSGCNLTGIMEKLVTDAGFTMDEFAKDMGAGGLGMNSWSNTKGMAMAIYPSPAGIMAGLFNQAVLYQAGDAAALKAGWKAAMTGMNGQVNNGITFTTTYTEAAEQIEGTAVDTYSMAMKFPPEQFQAQQAMSMMYGPAGLKGYVVSTKEGLYTTMSQSKSLATSLLQIANSGTGLNTDSGVKSVDDLLPADASLRTYIGVGTIGSQLAVFAAAMMPGVDFNALTTLPPIAAGVTVKEGTVSGTMVMPAALIKAGWDIAKQTQGGENDGGGNEEDEPPIF